MEIVALGGIRVKYRQIFILDNMKLTVLFQRDTGYVIMFTVVNGWDVDFFSSYSLLQRLVGIRVRVGLPK